MFNLEGTHVLITGAGGGIAGTAIPAMKRVGCVVYGVDRNGESLRAFQKEGVLDQIFVGDLTEVAFQRVLITELRGKVDVLVNNVGAGFSKTLEDTTREDFLRLYSLNFEVAAMLCQGFAPAMADRGGGKIINVSTALAENPLPTLSAYVASKAALTAFTRAIALQFAPMNVQANVLAPGYIGNDKHRDYFASQRGQVFLEQFVPTGVTGDPDALTGALLYLSSPLSNYMIGHVLVVDGGYSIW